jgi:hypothetical protein
VLCKNFISKAFIRFFTDKKENVYLLVPLLGDYVFLKNGKKPFTKNEIVFFDSVFITHLTLFNSYELASASFKVTLTNIKELDKKLFSDIFYKVKKIEDGHSQRLSLKEVPRYFY